MKRIELITKLTNLEIEEKALLRSLDITYYDKKKRTENFYKLKQVKKDIQKVKFELRLESEIRKNEKFRKKV